MSVVWAIAFILCTDLDRCTVEVRQTYETQGECRRALLTTKHPDPERLGTLAGRDCLRLLPQPVVTNETRPMRRPT